MCLLGDRLGVGSPGEVLCDVHPQEFSAADSLHSRGVDGQWGVVNRVSPEVHHNLLCLLHIEGQVVSATPFSQLFMIIINVENCFAASYFCGKCDTIQSWVRLKQRH